MKGMLEMNIIRGFIMLLFFGLILIGCSPSEEDSTNAESEEAELNVYTTIYPFQYAVEQIGGDTVSVETVYPPGADAHTYEPTSKDMTTIAESDAFIYLGAGMEGFAESAAEALANQDVKLIEIGQNDALFHGHTDEEHEEGHEHDHSSSNDEENTEGSITIDGIADHYHTGDAVQLTAVLSEASEHDHWHWYTLAPGEEEWQTVPDQGTATYEGEATTDGQQIKAALFGEDHNVIAESEPVTITIDDHGQDQGYEEGHEHNHSDEINNNEEASASTVTIDGLADHYHTGDTIQLTAVLNEASEHDHWHWYTLAPGEEEWQTVPDQGTTTYEGEATTDGQQIKAVLYGDDHHIIAESEPITITIDDHTGGHDPHVWIDPLRMIELSRMIKDELIALNPAEEATYTKNFEALEAELLALDESYKELLETKDNKHIIVPHAAFGYWEERYGVEQIAIAGLSSSQEPSQKQLTEVIDQAEKHNLNYILYEQNSQNRLSEVIQEQIGAETLTIHNLSVLTEDDIKNGEDYITLMEKNLEVLDKAME